MHFDVVWLLLLLLLLVISLPAAEFTKQFVTSVVVGKDVVPRLGLHQLETLRTSLMTAIKKSTNPKVRRSIIFFHR